MVLINWGCASGAFPQFVVADINGEECNTADDCPSNDNSQVYTILSSSEDWNHLIYAGGSVGGMGAGGQGGTQTNAPKETTLPIHVTSFRVEVASPGIAQGVPGTSLNLT